MRGKGCNYIEVIKMPRITPAYAGKSAKRYYIKSLTRDHPCICGEKNIPKVLITPSKGSPLHMRGKVPMIALVAEDLGITPAYAGKREYLG